MYALQIFVCNRDAETGELCKVCVKKSLTHPRHEPRLHGLLTEPIPDDSHIFGGAWYIRMVERFGPPDAKWVVEAEMNQKIAEGWVDGAWTADENQGAEKAQSIPPPVYKGMAEKAKKQGVKKEKEKEKEKETLPPPITHLDILYQESAKPIITLPTDSYTIKKGVYRDIPVWILPNGKMFDMDSAGNPRALLSSIYSV